MSCLNGSIAGSFSVFYVFDYMWQHYKFADFHTLFRYYSVLATALAVGAFLLYPDEPFKEIKNDEEREEKQEKEVPELEHLIQSSSSSIPSAELDVIHENLHHHFLRHIAGISWKHPENQLTGKGPVQLCSVGCTPWTSIRR